MSDVKQLPGEELTHVPQMSLRDWFAGQALSGLLASCSGETVKPYPTDYASKYSYQYADAMMAARRIKPKC